MPYSEVQRRAVEAHVSAWNLVTRANGAEPLEVAGWALACTGAPFKAVNHVISPDAPAPGDVAAVLDAAAARADAYVVQLWGEAPEDVGSALLDHGLEHTIAFPLMVRETAGIPDHAVPGLSIERVESEDDIAILNDVSAEVFGSPRAMGDVLSPRVVVKSPDCAYFLARLEGRPVATSIAIVSGDTVGVYAVTTVEEARGRGIGAAVTWAVVAYGAQRGATLAYLQSSKMGFGVYSRMGFDVVGSHALYETPA